MKQVAEYIIPIIKDGKNCVPDFLQAKELIRCKDCKYYKWEIDMCNLEGATVFPMNVVHDDDYCSRAVRKPPQVNPEMVKALKDRIEKQRGEDAKRKS